jgi:hypothetical protein
MKRKGLQGLELAQKPKIHSSQLVFFLVGPIRKELCLNLTGQPGSAIVETRIRSLIGNDAESASG